MERMDHMEEDTSLPIFRIGQVSLETGRCRVTIYSAEKEGRIPKAKKDSSGHRRYSRDQIEEIKGLIADNT